MAVTKQYKLVTLFLTLNIAFQLVSDATAGKIISVFGVGVSVTVIYFPVVYIISDVITEVYGYSVARTILWYTVIASVIAGTMYQIAIYVPSPDFFDNADAYRTVFNIVPRVLIGGWIAVFAGDISNNYVLAKMKIITGGKHLWTRTIGSTVIGQFVNTAVFYSIGLSGVLPFQELIMAVLAGWAIKTMVEIAMTPVTYGVVGWVKSVEDVDVYDKDTDFNPFIIR